MLLTVDMGNTNITIGAYENDSLRFVSRLSTIRGKTADQYAIEFNQIFRLHSASAESFSGSIISSVVPELTETVCDTIEKVTGTVPMIVGPGIKTGINILIDNPAQLGSDLLVGAVAAVDKYPLPCLIVDLGTASKISVVGKDASYRGGMIAPGVAVSLNALSSNASQLPRISLAAPKKAVGTNTVDCMQSGIIFGTAAMVDGMVQRFKEEIPGVASVVATGGFSNCIIEHCRENIIHDDTLLLHGLKVIYEKNRKS
ncbi:MAG: type III pantothenate kinase [Acutalibacteraceae bacterium]|nr:type III pantothenate kinase [Oscillospiraceae bacterium]